MRQNNINTFLFLFITRFLKPKRHFFPNIGICMSSLAVSMSVAILIIVMSVMNGFTAELIKKILGLNSHITVYSKKNDFSNFKEIQKDIGNINNVKLAFPVVNGSGMIFNQSRNNTGLFIKGISKKAINENQDLSKTLIADINNFTGFKIIVGKEIARQMRLKQGDQINLIVPLVANTMLGAVPRQVRMEVAGFISSNSQQYDNYMAIIPFKTAQLIFGMKQSASGIEIIANDPENLVSIESVLIDKKKELFFSDWKDENSALLHALNVEANVMALILSLFVIIASFTIFAVIRMMIKSKEREIAILKSHGVSDKQIHKIFFCVGLVIAFAGMLFGNIIGISFAVNVDNIRIFLEKLFNTKLLDGSVYLLSNLPSKLMMNDIIKTNIFVFITSIVCTIVSVKKHTKINIVEILRNN